MSLVQRGGKFCPWWLWRVSIHYMSLVQFLKLEMFALTPPSFNTLYVVGSIGKNRASVILLYLKIGLYSTFSNHLKILTISC